MGKETRPASTEEIFAGPVSNAPALRAAVNQSLASSSVNPVAMGNQAIIAKKKRAILYKNGYTLPGKAATLLAAEALSGIKHSQKLGGNIRKANPGTSRPSATDAHHVVASEASGARVSRTLNVSDVVVANSLLHGEETVVFADSGYRGAAKRPDAKPGVSWQIARRPSSRKPFEKEGKLGQIIDEIEYLKASVRAKVEHAFRVIKRQFGHTKVRYRGLAKNTAQLHTLFALTNL